MANKNWPMGFQAVQKIGGGVPVVHHYSINGTPTIYKGEPLKLVLSTSGGMVRPWTTKTTFNAAAAGGGLVGVAAEFNPPSSTKTRIAVWDPLENIFQVKVGPGASPSTTNEGTYLFKNADAATLRTGSTITGLSGAYLDFDSINVGTGQAANPIKIVDICKEIGFNDPTSPYVHVLCQFQAGFPFVANTTPA